MRKKLGTLIRRTLDHRGGRWLLEKVATAYSLYSRREWTRIYHKDGLWIHKCRDGYIVERYVNFTATPAYYKAKTIDDWCYFYQPREGDIIIDVGAGIGTEAAYLSQAIGPSGLLISIEAHPETYKALDLFCRLNELNNITRINAAIHDKQEEVFIDNPEMHVGSSIIGTGNGVIVSGTTLDDIIREHELKNIDFIKMNIEGAEKLALAGMEETLKITRYVCISCHDFKADKIGNEALRSKEYVESFLVFRGYKILQRMPDARPWIQDQVNALNDHWLGI